MIYIVRFIRFSVSLVIKIEIWKVKFLDDDIDYFYCKILIGIFEIGND